MLVAPLLDWRTLRDRPLAALDLGADRIPQRVIDDPEVSHPDAQPLGFIADPIKALAPVGVRIPPPLAPLPNELAAIQRVVEDADELLERVAWVRAALLEYYGGDTDRMEAFLRSSPPLLGGQTPLQKSLRSDRDAREVIALARVDVVGTVLRVSRDLAKAWRLTDCEQAGLLGVETAQLKAWQIAEPDELPSDVLARTSLLLGIYRAINTLLPIPERADAWIRKPNAAALFEGRAAIEVLMEGLDGMRQLHSYLRHQTE